MTAQEKFDQIVEDVKQVVPNFRTTLKSQSKFHAFLGWILARLGNPNYMTGYWTTIGSVCARPTVCDTGALEDEWKVIAHELQHARDCNKIGFLPFAFLYLFPQIIGILALLLVPFIFIYHISLYYLLFLVCLAPLPALGRAYIEYRAYVVTLATCFWTKSLPENEELCIDWITSSFIGPGYYFMFPFKGMVKNIFTAKLNELKTGTFVLDSYLAFVRTKCFQYNNL